VRGGQGNPTDVWTVRGSFRHLASPGAQHRTSVAECSLHRSGNTTTISTITDAIAHCPNHLPHGLGTFATGRSNGCHFLGNNRCQGIVSQCGRQVPLDHLGLRAF
jgi:hypothetical protein